MCQFANFLSEQIFEKVSRNELMTKLQLKYEIFRNLDAITLSRWSNGVTSPSLEKQLIIAKEQNLTDEFLTMYSKHKASAKLNKLVESFWYNMDSSFHSIMHHDDHKRIEFKQSYYSECSNKYPLYDKLKKAFNINTVEQANDFFMQRFNFVSSQEPEKILSHTSLYTDLISAVRNLCVNSSVDRAIEEVSKSNDHVVMGLSMYASSEDHKILLGLVGNHLLENYFEKKNLLIITRGTTSSNIFEMANSTQVCCLKHSNQFDNLYLYKHSLTEFIGNPLVFKLISEQRTAYKSLIYKNRN